MPLYTVSTVLTFGQQIFCYWWSKPCLTHRVSWCFNHEGNPGFSWSSAGMLCQRVRFGTHNNVKLGKSVVIRSTIFTFVMNFFGIGNFAVSTPGMTPGRGTWQHFANFYSFPSERYVGGRDHIAHAQQRTFRSSKEPVSYSVVMQVECSSFLNVVNLFTHPRAQLCLNCRLLPRQCDGGCVIPIQRPNDAYACISISTDLTPWILIF